MRELSPNFWLKFYRKVKRKQKIYIRKALVATASRKYSSNTHQCIIGLVREREKEKQRHFGTTVSEAFSYVLSSLYHSRLLSVNILEKSKLQTLRQIFSYCEKWEHGRVTEKKNYTFSFGCCVFGIDGFDFGVIHIMVDGTINTVMGSIGFRFTHILLSWLYFIHIGYKYPQNHYALCCITIGVALHSVLSTCVFCFDLEVVLWTSWANCWWVMIWWCFVYIHKQNKCHGSKNKTHHRKYGKCGFVWL